MERRHRRVRLLGRPSGDEEWVETDVVDDGPGMPDMEAEVLETGEETQLRHGGHLGLWLVRILVRRAGGERVDAAPTGTTVSFRVPRADSADADASVPTLE